MTRAMQRSGILVCLVVAAASAVHAVYDLGRLGSLIASQASGAAQGTDFLNLYTGADLLLHAPRDLYDLGAQQAVEQALTGRQSLIVPFLLPPYGALLVSWLALVPYGTAYIGWLVIGVVCVAVSAAWMAPHWGGRWYPLVWVALALLYLPAFLGLVQGQTTALMLLAFAGVHRWLRTQPPATWQLAVCLLVWTLKPQLVPWLVVGLLLARRRAAVVVVLGILGALSLVAAAVIPPVAISAYGQLTRQKLQEVFIPDISLLPGPTLLHAAEWSLGYGWSALVAAAALVGIAVVAFGVIWRRGAATDDAILVQLAALPIVSIICAPYALVHELTAWLASFWLLWEYTRCRPIARAIVLWVTAGVWVAGDTGVVVPLAGGSDFAALLGLGLLSMLAWLIHCHEPEQATQPNEPGVWGAIRAQPLAVPPLVR
jgi:Glycosyltransferase family 87